MRAGQEGELRRHPTYGWPQVWVPLDAEGAPKRGWVAIFYLIDAKGQPGRAVAALRGLAQFPDGTVIDWRALPTIVVQYLPGTGTQIDDETLEALEREADAAARKKGGHA